jgi:protein transport protein SEC61 subunit alpha
LLVGAKIIKVDQKNKEDKELINSAQKLVAVGIATFEAVAYVFSGIYGEIEDIGAIKAFLIVFQLITASILVNLLDEIMQKGGYGLVSAISMFIGINVCEEFLWKSFSFMKTGDDYEGAFVSFFHALFMKPNKIAAFRQGFMREGLTNLNNVAATVIIFMVVNFF